MGLKYPRTKEKKKRSDKFLEKSPYQSVELMSLDKMSQPSRKAVEVNAIDEKQKIRFTVDSGAAETVCKKTDAKDFSRMTGKSI